VLVAKRTKNLRCYGNKEPLGDGYERYENNFFENHVAMNIRISFITLGYVT